ncbi:PTR2 domain-containing protein [Cephalotus follicularis]|uniref:PTR2 domain-containing protein n=1 Tax=Cephalotus follicularis TaxID=3775 RepID=A0A1Q3BRY9_CEPFO|nr:PTR2 domain-containing protein [Cephalotus follicularis]
MAMEMSSQNQEFIDWKGQKANPKKHGGSIAASFACVVEVLENMVFLSNAINFIAYFISSMNYSPADAANMVTNFMGTSFLLTIFGGFISDSFLTRFWTFIIFCSIELLGLILLTVQAECPKLQPAMHKRPSQSQAAVLFIGLYAMATGVGGVKASLPAHGADQLNHGNQKHISSFFSWFFFSLCTGGLISATVMVWIEDNKGWNWSFKLSLIALSFALCIFISGFPIYRYKLPAGSPLTRIFKVFASTFRNWKASPAMVHNTEETNLDSISDGRPNNKFRFLNKALSDGSVSAVEVEETKTILGLLPIFATTIMMNCCLAQLQTFSVEQGNIMNRKLKHFKIPTQSLSVLPLTFMLVSIPCYEHFVKIFWKKSQGGYTIFQPLKRIGLGLALASGSMAVAAVVEAKRRNAAIYSGATISVFWLAWQYLLLGISDMLTLGGTLEFFYSQAPDRMRSSCTALSWCSTSMGFFFSSLLVTISDKVSGQFGKAWLEAEDLNHNRLDLFYTLLCVLNLLNFLNYIYWAKRY